jgi:phage terminase large subunit GpA-like protein
LVTRALAGGYKKSAWEKRRDRNEALDARVYAMAAMATLRLETWTPERWDDLQAALTVSQDTVQTAFVKKPVPPFKSFGPRETNE